MAKKDSEHPQLVKVEEMAKILDVPKSWIYDRTRRNDNSIPCIKVGKYLRFDPAQVIEHFRQKS
ncbi:helix-turn-helix domain-containing protein [Omnitrophica bacterium]|nr:helix-turn-helix domain-containing protein [Candidatus Omnitrophota bacterium]